MTDFRAAGGPPRWAEAVLRLILRPEDRDAISGDLLEEHQEVQQAQGRLHAHCRYFAQTFSLVLMEIRRRINTIYILAACWNVFVYGVLLALHRPLPSLTRTIALDLQVFMLFVTVALMSIVGGILFVSGWFYLVVVVQRRRTLRSLL